MDNFLLKLAKQLDSIDEASLMALWDKYAAIVSRFEPSRRWEEAALVFSMIQAKRWKNQLFNYHWSEQARPPEGGPDGYDTSFSLEVNKKDDSGRKSKILNFVMPDARPEDKKDAKPEGKKEDKPENNNEDK